MINRPDLAMTVRLIKGDIAVVHATRGQTSLHRWCSWQVGGPILLANYRWALAVVGRDRMQAGHASWSAVSKDSPEAALRGTLPGRISWWIKAAKSHALYAGSVHAAC
jgi:hypothetical protein